MHIRRLVTESDNDFVKVFTMQLQYCIRVFHPTHPSTQKRTKRMYKYMYECLCGCTYRYVNYVGLLAHIVRKRYDQTLENNGCIYNK